MSKHRIRDVMTASPHTVGSDEKLSVAHVLMKEHDLRHLPVLRGDELIGILTQRDLYFIERMAGVDPKLDVVGDAMNPEVYTTTADAHVRDVAKEMAENRYGCAVVLEHGHVVGVFTTTDALRHLADVLA